MPSATKFSQLPSIACASPGFTLEISTTSPKLKCVLRVHFFRGGMNSRLILKALKTDGWYEVSTVGSHVQLKHAAKPGRVTLPHPRKDAPVGTLKSIEKQAALKLS